MLTDFLEFQGLNFATAPTLTDTGASGGADTGGGAGTGSTGAPAASGTGTGTTPANTGSQINWETAPAQFRESYKALKQSFEALEGQVKPWQTLGVQPEQVGQFRDGYQQVYTEIKGIGEQLQYPESEIADAIRTHGLVKVLDHLRQESWQAEQAAQGNQDVLNEQQLEERINSVAERVLSPIQQREDMRMTMEANSLVERTIGELATNAFKTAGLDFAAAPPELRDFVLTGVTEALKYDDEGLQALKFQGKTAPIQKAFQTFQSMFDAAYLARKSMESRIPVRPGQPPQRQQQQATKLPSLDEMLDSPDVIRTAQGKPAYSS